MKLWQKTNVHVKDCEVDQANLNFLGAATAGTFATAWIGRLFWRRLARDGAEVAKDRAEINILKTLQEQVQVLVQENESLRKNESDLERRLGQLEAKEQEAKEAKELIERMTTRLEEKDNRIERLIRSHADETSAMRQMISQRDQEIDLLRRRIGDLESRLRHDESIMERRAALRTEGDQA